MGIYLRKLKNLENSGVSEIIHLKICALFNKLPDKN